MFQRVETPRLILRKPAFADIEAIYTRYARDPEVTRLLAWSRHTSPEATRAFLEFSDSEWAHWPAGPYLIECRADGSLLGSTGLAFETPERASTGYVLARDAWGKGYATEALLGIVEIGRRAGLKRLYALCHVTHAASQRVLEKGGFEREDLLRSHTVFPNLGPTEPEDVFVYACRTL